MDQKSGLESIFDWGYYRRIEEERKKKADAIAQKIKVYPHLLKVAGYVNESITYNGYLTRDTSPNVMLKETHGGYIIETYVFEKCREGTYNFHREQHLIGHILIGFDLDGHIKNNPEIAIFGGSSAEKMGRIERKLLSYTDREFDLRDFSEKVYGNKPLHVL